MTTLLRAPVECASWSWDLRRTAQSGLESALLTAARICDVLRVHDLVRETQGLTWDWDAPGIGALGITTTLSLVNTSLSDGDLPARIRACRPAGFPDADFMDLTVVSRGAYLDSRGELRTEENLVELSVSADSIGLAADLSVYHDIWTDYDFFGHPHPDVYERNAPRLAAALRELDTTLGVAAEPGEPTYFGRAEGYGVAKADSDDVVDGRANNRSDLL